MRVLPGPEPPPHSPPGLGAEPPLPAAPAAAPPSVVPQGGPAWPCVRASAGGPPSPREAGQSNSSREAGATVSSAGEARGRGKESVHPQTLFLENNNCLELWARTCNPPGLSWHFGNVNRFAGFLFFLWSKERNRGNRETLST